MSAPARAGGGQGLETAIPLSDFQLERALESAHLPSLLAALGVLTADSEHEALRPARYRMTRAQGGMSEPQQAAVRAHALEVLRAVRDGRLASQRPDRALVSALLEPILGDDHDAYVELSLEELGLDRPDPRGPDWHVSDFPAAPQLDVIVIGAGLSGLLAAHRLHQAGVPFTVLERNADLGGTWFENHYPGCRVDVPSHLYAYSSACEEDWADHYTAAADVEDYLRRFARDNDLRDHIRLGTEVEEAVWDAERLRWRVRAHSADGPRELEAAVVVCAVGQLNRPLIPAIEGSERFAGAALHSARWDHEVEVDGKRVAVIGTGASAVQIVPELARRAAHLTVFQRSPVWLLPTPEFRRGLDEGQRALLRHVPTYARWYRFWLGRGMLDSLVPYATQDPGWEPQSRAVSAANDRQREVLTAYLERQFGDRPDLLAGVLPSYPPYAKRAVRDDGAWARALFTPGVSLVTEPIAQLTETGVLTADARHHDLDVLVYATGFQASRFLVPMRIIGRDGVDLHDRWGADARAYLGMTVPGFPNFFMLYGPNTNVVITGSVTLFGELQVRYVLGCLRRLAEAGGGALDCRSDVHDAYNERVDELNAGMAWGCADVQNWYRSASGRVSQNWPSTTLEYWERTRAPRPDDFALLTAERPRAGGYPSSGATATW